MTKKQAKQNDPHGHSHIVKLLYYPYRIRKKIEIIHRLICISFIMIWLYAFQRGNLAESNSIFQKPLHGKLWVNNGFQVLIKYSSIASLSNIIFRPSHMSSIFKQFIKRVIMWLFKVKRNFMTPRRHPEFLLVMSILLTVWINWLKFNPIVFQSNKNIKKWAGTKKPPSSIAVSLKQKRSTYLFFNASRSATAVSNCARIGFNNACLRLKLALFTIKREDTLQISSKGSKPLARKVFPVSTTSTI